MKFRNVRGSNFEYSSFLIIDEISSILGRYKERFFVHKHNKDNRRLIDKKGTEIRKNGNRSLHRELYCCSFISPQGRVINDALTNTTRLQKLPSLWLYIHLLEIYIFNFCMKKIKKYIVQFFRIPKIFSIIMSCHSLQNLECFCVLLERKMPCVRPYVDIKQHRRPRQSLSQKLIQNYRLVEKQNLKF